MPISFGLRNASAFVLGLCLRGAVHWFQRGKKKQWGSVGTGELLDAEPPRDAGDAECFGERRPEESVANCPLARLLGLGLPLENRYFLETCFVTALPFFVQKRECFKH